MNMPSRLSDDISGLFKAYSVDQPEYEELSELERYQKVKQKWQGLKATTTPADSFKNNNSENVSITGNKEKP